MARFNQLYSLVHDDRASPQSEKMERELLAFCRAQAGMNNEQHNEQLEGGISGDNALVTAEAMPIEAASSLRKGPSLLLKIPVSVPCRSRPFGLTSSGTARGASTQCSVPPPPPIAAAPVFPSACRWLAARDATRPPCSRSCG